MKKTESFNPLLTATLGLTITFAAVGQEPASPGSTSARQTPKNEKGKWVPLFERHANEYVLHVGKDAQAGSIAKRLPDPVLRWWQPVRGGDDGALYLWIREGRPVAAITFFTFKLPDGDRFIVHESHSFTSDPLRAIWRNNDVWNPSVPGLTFKPVPESPSPAETPAARLRQMQAIVREFSAHTIDDKNSKWPLRPLNTPLYRFEGTNGPSRDGALFALAQGTDPEAFLVLDCRGEGKEARWEYGAARFTDLRLIVEHKGRVVFEGPNELGGPRDIYYSTTVQRKPTDTPADFE